MAFNHNSNLLVTGGVDGMIRLYGLPLPDSTVIIIHGTLHRQVINCYNYKGHSQKLMDAVSVGRECNVQLSIEYKVHTM